jgi:hypothetical protein
MWRMTRSRALAVRLRAEGLPLIPAGLTIAVVTAWAATGGGYESQPALGAGYDPDPWYLGALMLVGLLCATAFGLGATRLSRSAKIASGAFALYVLWSFLSISWAHDRGAAFLGSDRALVYLTSFLTFAILPWRGWSVRVALGMLVAGLGALAIVTTIRLAVLADPASLFLNARLSYPLGYYNADAAMFMTVAMTAIGLCSRRSAQPALRVAGIVLAALCLQLAVLGQSRGWLFTAPIVLALTLVLVPDRLRLLAFALGPAVATAAIAPALLHVYGHATAGGVALAEPGLAQILHREGTHAVRTMAIADTTLALVAALAVLVDRRISPGEAAQRRARRIGRAIAVMAVLAGVTVGLVATHGHPLARMEHAWSSFANVNNTANGSSRFSTLGSQRVDFWRVALHEFGRHPLLGIGQDNFAASYLRHRRTDQEPRWTHSIELRLLTHTGLVGALLFALFLVAMLLASLSGSRREASDANRASAAIALLPFVVWLVHGSIDWLWELPALAVPALAFAGAASALGDAGRHDSIGERSDRSIGANSDRARLLAVAGRICVAVLGIGALVAVVVPFVVARKVQTATAIWPQRPGRAYAELRSASNLMPFDTQIYLIGGAIALNLEDSPAARYWFTQAQRHDDQTWLAPFALGLLEGEQGRLASARVQLIRARALDPHEPVIAIALSRLARGRPLDFPEAQRLLASRTRQRFGH